MKHHPPTDGDKTTSTIATDLLNLTHEELDRAITQARDIIKDAGRLISYFRATKAEKDRNERINAAPEDQV